MSITEAMKIGTNGFTPEQMDEEQARRLKVIERINYMDEIVKRINIQLVLLPENYKCCKIWKNKKTRYLREFKQIKAAESEWLKHVAWFIY